MARQQGGPFARPLDKQHAGGGMKRGLMSHFVETLQDKAVSGILGDTLVGEFGADLEEIG